MIVRFQLTKKEELLAKPKPTQDELAAKCDSKSVNIDNEIPIEEFSDAEIIETVCPSQNNEVAEEVIETIHAAQIGLVILMVKIIPISMVKSQN